MPTLRAISTARLDGAPTAAITGMPAIAAFCTSSKLARPLTTRTLSVGGQAPVEQQRPHQLVDGVVAPHVLVNDAQSSAGREQPRGVQSARLVECLLHRSQHSRKAVHDRCGDAQVMRIGITRDVGQSRHERIQRRSPANTTRAAGYEGAAGGLHRRFGVGTKLDQHGIIVDDIQGQDLARVGDHPL